VIVSDVYVSHFGYDKWETNQFCKTQQIPYPQTFLPTEREKIRKYISKRGFPLIVKPKVGYGSRDVVLVRNPEELKVFIKRIEDPVVQEYLKNDSEEYTASSFVTEDQQIIGTIIFRRYLSAGATYKAEVITDRKMTKQVEAIVRRVAPLGPCNIQFRKAGNKIVPFEFNVRFSGTTPIRSSLGFNDAEMALRHFVLGQKLKKPKVKKGVAFRYWNEIIVRGQGFDRIRKAKQINRQLFDSVCLDSF